MPSPPTAAARCRPPPSTARSRPCRSSAWSGTRTSTTAPRATTSPSTPPTCTSSAGAAAGSARRPCRAPTSWWRGSTSRSGFASDISHAAVHGLCRTCREASDPRIAVPRDHRAAGRVTRMSTSTATSPLLARHGAVEGQGADAGVAVALRRPGARAAAARRGAGGGRPVAPRGRDGHRARPAVWLHSMTTQHLLGPRSRASRASRSCCRPRGTSSTPCTSSTTARRRGSRSSPARHPRSWRGWSRCASCCASRSPT